MINFNASKIVSLVGLTSLCLVLLIQCSSKQKKVEVPYEPEIWRINPGSTVLNKQKQFFITGLRLDTIEVIAGESVSLSPGKISGNSTKQTFIITVTPFQKSGESDFADELGKREIKVKVGGKTESLFIKILDEDPTRRVVDMNIKLIDDD